MKRKEGRERVEGKGAVRLFLVVFSFDWLTKIAFNLP